MSDDRAAYRTRPVGTELDPSTLSEIQAAYSQILNSGGFGKIRIYIENAGSTKERQIVSVEIEKKTR